MAGGWRRLHNEELHNLYASSDTVRVIRSRRMRLAGHIACMGEVENAYNILGEKPEGKRPLGRPREIGWKGVDWMPVAGPCEHVNEPLGSTKGAEFLH